MKDQICWIRHAGVMLLVLLLATGCLERVAGPAEHAALPAENENQNETAADAAPLEGFDFYGANRGRAHGGKHTKCVCEHSSHARCRRHACGDRTATIDGSSTDHRADLL